VQAGKAKHAYADVIIYLCLKYQFETNIADENKKQIEDFAPFVANASRVLFASAQMFNK
jgi:hypothetical protein